MIDIEAARKVCEAATPGPWEVVNRWDSSRSVATLRSWDHIINVEAKPYWYDNGPRRADILSHDNADFIAAARTILPLAIDELEAARKEVERLKRVLKDVRETSKTGQISPTVRRYINAALSPDPATKE